MSGSAGTIWGKTRRRLLSLAEAWDKITAEVTPIDVTTVALREAAGRFLAVPIATEDDSPAFDRAKMDGFAVRSADCAAPEADLKVVGLAPAGEMSASRVGSGEAIRINTGAPVPPGADAVVQVEQTTPSADGSSVQIHAAVRPHQHITRQGSDRRKGDIVLSPPVRLGPAQLAAAATAGAHSISVYREVGVGIVVTGDELVPIGEAGKPGKVRESNGPMLAALMQQFGARPAEPSLARDKLAELRDRFSAAMAQPVVVAVGGMSMGTLDLVPQALESLGVRWVFHGVAVKPGKPVAYGLGPGGQHVFGLPGNPASAFVCAWLFVRMAITGLQGFAPPQPPRRWRATLNKSLEASRDPRPAFLPARVWNEAQRGMVVEPCAWGGSGDPFGLAAANALLFRARPTQEAEAGGMVEVILIAE